MAMRFPQKIASRTRSPGVADAWFNRNRYLAERAVGDFNDRLRNSFDVGEVASDLQSASLVPWPRPPLGLRLRTR